MKETLELKKQEVADAVAKINESAAFVAFKYQGLTVAKFQEIRREMRANGGEIFVLKNNTSRRAVKEAGYEDLESVFSGPIAIAFSKEDAVAPAKVLFKAAGEKDSKVEVLKGVVDGQIYSFDQLKALSVLPSRETLLTQLAAGMYGTLSQLSIGLNMLAEKKDGATEAQA